MKGRSTGTRYVRGVRSQPTKISLYPEDVARLERLAERFDRSASWVVRHATELLEKSLKAASPRPKCSHSMCNGSGTYVRPDGERYVCCLAFRPPP